MTRHQVLSTHTSKAKVTASLWTTKVFLFLGVLLWAPKIPPNQIRVFRKVCWMSEHIYYLLILSRWLDKQNVVEPHNGVLLRCFSPVWLLVTLWTEAHQAPWNFPGKNTGVGCHFLLQMEYYSAIKKMKDYYMLPEKAMATHSSVLAWRIPGTAEPGGLLSAGSHRVRHDWSDLAAAAAALDATTWLNLKNILSEKIKHTKWKKARHKRNIVWLHLHEVCRTDKSIEMESRLVLPGAVWGGSG